jgi:hypothetical protein
LRAVGEAAAAPDGAQGAGCGSMSAIDTVLDRLGPYKLRENGRDRWRAACPACGATNPSTLSIGIGDNGGVLLHCFHSECDVEQIAQALGLDLVDLFPALDRPGGGALPLKRRRMLSATQALDVLHDESLVVWVIATDVHAGKPVGEADHERLTRAVARIGALRAEVYA